MTSTAAPLAPADRFRAAGRLAVANIGSIAGWLVAFAVTTYLGLSGGGFDIVARSEIGIAVWWVLLLACVAGLLPLTALSRPTWIAVAIFGLFFLWIWIAASWAPSEDVALQEVGRVATYGGIFVLGACLVQWGSGRAIVGGVAAGIGVVASIAVLSKLAPSIFPSDATARFYATTRLRYPFDYSDGVGEYAAIGVPLLLFLAGSARTLAGRALAAASLPVVLICLAMTVSRGGILAVVVGIAVFLAVAPDRLPRLATLAVTGVVTAGLVVALLHRHGLTDQLNGAAPAAQRHSMLLLLLAGAAVCALAEVALALADRRARVSVSPRVAHVTAIVIVALLVAGVVVFFAGGAASQVWHDFKQPNPKSGGSTYSRLLSVGGSHRYQYWQAAIHAFDQAPWKGLGPGSFRVFWAQHNSLSEYVINAHSLWVETLAELGIIGLGLIAGFFVWVVGRGSQLALRAPGGDAARAAAVAGVAAFCGAAAFDWVWQIGVVPMLTMLLAATALARPVSREPAGTRGRPAEAARAATPRRAVIARVSMAVAALIALWAIAVPLSSSVSLRRSAAADRGGDTADALARAADAARLEPGAASPYLQRALVLEHAGDVAGAARAIGEAERREPTSWRIWLVASRVATENDQPAVALGAYRRARSLNPTSPLFAR